MCRNALAVAPCEVVLVSANPLRRSRLTCFFASGHPSSSCRGHPHLEKAPLETQGAFASCFVSSKIQNHLPPCGSLARFPRLHFRAKLCAFFPPPAPCALRLALGGCRLPFVCSLSLLPASLLLSFCGFPGITADGWRSYADIGAACAWVELGLSTYAHERPNPANR